MKCLTCGNSLDDCYCWKEVSAYQLKVNNSEDFHDSFQETLKAYTQHVSDVKSQNEFLGMLTRLERNLKKKILKMEDEIANLVARIRALQKETELFFCQRDFVGTHGVELPDAGLNLWMKQNFPQSVKRVCQDQQKSEYLFVEFRNEFRQIRKLLHHLPRGSVQILVEGGNVIVGNPRKVINN
eukprot:m.191861 g.191861  ORF g.191861 m.191861 type:complete len:183 (+) comp39455_c0_seq8:490-1038(+)